MKQKQKKETLDLECLFSPYMKLQLISNVGHLCYRPLSRPYSASPTVRAAGNTNRPYREHCKGGWLCAWLPTHCKGGSNVNRPYSVGRGALLVSFSRSGYCRMMNSFSTQVKKPHVTPRQLLEGAAGPHPTRVESVECPQQHHTWHRPTSMTKLVGFLAKLSGKFDE